MLRKPMPKGGVLRKILSHLAKPALGKAGRREKSKPKEIIRRPQKGKTKGIQKWNKRQGMGALRRAYQKLPEIHRVIRIANYEVVRPVSSELELFGKVRKFAREHPEAKRIFIRGNPIRRIAGKEKNRVAQWISAPRANYYTAEHQMVWDTNMQAATRLEQSLPVKPVTVAEKWREVEWMLYPTQMREDIKREGVVKFRVKDGGARITKTWLTGLQSMTRGRVMKNTAQEIAVHALVTELAKHIGSGTAMVRFVEWKHAPGVLEFYDVTAM